MRILLCDDDVSFVAHLTHFLEEYFTIRNFPMPEIQAYYDGASLLRDSGNQDMIFLDIEMEGITGIEVGRQLMERNNTGIIFIITAYTEYLDDALRFHAFRYLSKPLDMSRLFRNLDDALIALTSRSKEVLLETKNGCISLSTSDIVYIETRNRSTIVYTLCGDYPSLKNVASWSKELPSGCFAVSHKNYLVNLMHVFKFNHDTVYFDVDKPPAYLARRKYTEFKKAYLQYLANRRSAI